MYQRRFKFLPILLTLLISIGAIIAFSGESYTYAEAYNEDFNLYAKAQSKHIREEIYTKEIMSENQKYNKYYIPTEEVSIYDELSTTPATEEMATISGTVYLPDGEVAPKGGIYVYLYAETYGNKQYNHNITIPEGSNSAEYSIKVPKDHVVSVYIIRFIAFPNQGNLNYIDEGYYNADKTVMTRENATVIDIDENDNIKDIDITLLKSVKIEGTLSMPVGDTADEYIQVEIMASCDETRDTYSEWFRLSNNKSKINYSINIPEELANNKWLVSYNISENTTEYSYASTGYYSVNGTVIDMKDATPITLSDEGAQNINMEFIPSEDVIIKDSVDILIKGISNISRYDIGIFYKHEGGYYEDVMYSDVGDNIIFENQGKNTKISIIGLDWDLTDKYYMWISNQNYNDNINTVLNLEITEDKKNETITIDPSNLNATIDNIDIEIADDELKIKNLALSYILPDGETLGMIGSFHNVKDKVTLPTGHYRIQVVAEDSTKSYNLFIEDFEVIPGQNNIRFDANSITKLNIDSSKIEDKYRLIKYTAFPMPFNSVYVSSISEDKIPHISKLDYGHISFNLLDRKGWSYEFESSTSNATNGISINIDDNITGVFELPDQTYIPGRHYYFSEYLLLKDSYNNKIRRVNDELLYKYDIFEWNMTFSDGKGYTYKARSRFNYPYFIMPNKTGIFNLEAVTNYTGTRDKTPSNLDVRLTTQIVIGEAGPVVPVTGVKLDKSVLNMNIGEKLTLNATVFPNNATNKLLTWSSGNKSVATVDQLGQVTAKGEGTTTIYVTTVDGQYTASCKVNVKDPTIYVEGVSIKNSITLNIGNEYTLEPVVYPEDAWNKSVNFELIEGDNIIELDTVTGKIIALASGSAKVLITTEDGGFKTECTITVIDLSDEKPDGGKTIVIGDEAYTWDYLFQNRQLLSKALNQPDIEVYVKLSNNIYVDKNGNLIFMED